MSKWTIKQWEHPHHLYRDEQSVGTLTLFTAETEKQLLDILNHDSTRFWQLEAEQWRKLFEEQRGGTTFNNLQAELVKARAEIDRLNRERDEAIIKYAGEANVFERQRNRVIQSHEETREELRQSEENRKMILDVLERVTKKDRTFEDVVKAEVIIKLNRKQEKR